MLAPLVRAGVRAVIALLAGAVFGLGLALAGMIDPHKVLGFLDVAGAWDASLLLVLGGAVLVALAGFRLARRQPAPLFDDHFHAAASQRVDVPLLAGSALFGIGWGLAGYCPGPAIAALGFGSSEALWFVPAMLLGTALQRWRAGRGRPAAPLSAASPSDAPSAAPANRTAGARPAAR
ncbi:MAG: YeeE/YedE family protein [Piscinibacter sp.]